MKYLVRWQTEGTTVLDAKDSEHACDIVAEAVSHSELSRFYSHDTKYDEPQILSCELVDRSSQ